MKKKVVNYFTVAATFTFTLETKIRKKTFQEFIFIMKNVQMWAKKGKGQRKSRGRDTGFPSYKRYKA